jgi:predicted tellurium resistance membrane protein TerC
MTLRALFAILITLEDRFRYLQHAISAILTLVGTNMILDAVSPSSRLSLPVMLLAIAGAVQQYRINTGRVQCK